MPDVLVGVPRMSAHTNLLRNLYAFHSRLLHFERNSLSLQRRLLFCKAVDKMDKSCQAIEKVRGTRAGHSVTPSHSHVLHMPS